MKPTIGQRDGSFFGHQRPAHIHRQQVSDSIMIWAGIINDQIVYPGTCA